MPIPAPAAGALPPVTRYQTFTTHVQSAFGSTTSAILSLTQPKGVQNVANPDMIAEVNAKRAVDELGIALQQDAPQAGIDAATKAQGLIGEGVFQMTHRLNGPLPTRDIVGLFSEGQ